MQKVIGTHFLAISMGMKTCISNLRSDRLMAIRKPNGGAKAASTAPLTSVQDTRSRGNGNGNGERVLMSFKIPSDLKMMLQENARERGTTASRIIIDGIRHELGLDD